MAHPTRVTYPGTVRFAPNPGPGKASAPWQAPVDAKGKPIAIVKNHDDRGNFTGSTLVLPAGKRFTYTMREPREPGAKGETGRPIFFLTLENEVPLHEHALHAEIEHRPATELEPAAVLATSTKYPVSASGRDAAEATKLLVLAVGEHLDDMKKKPDERQPRAEGAKPDDAKTTLEIAADVAAELHKSKPPPAPKAEPDAEPKHDGELVERHG